MTILEHLQRCSVCDSIHYNLLQKGQNVSVLAQEIGFSAHIQMCAACRGW
jgi:predicted anti-sigma-YlaC factor YlaD